MLTSSPKRLPGEAELKYLDADFKVVRPGDFVVCAVTGKKIPVQMLRYWSVDLQEAYADAYAASERLRGDLTPKKDPEESA